ncbi:alpha/beta fold hydrolase [Bacillus suaedaesalsae]|uniref:Alpha/beta hydrolase n=1 Tax=Bacillus suaedaesalsae TaxID=2810349 RepID=A0ABS2DK32_9BACI|nr:alpha/beta hydrolase [Bacillus suaedaesalsae]MBM6618844.1 alpha/beta hydrolase [Bacillus suaedaesalsae]
MIGNLIEIRGKKIYIEQFGLTSNPPILYLHGGPGESCYDFTYHQKSRLEKHFRVIAIDQRGVCRSEVIAEGENFSLDDLINDCEAIREYLHISTWSVIGHSFGGYVALLYASTYPHSIDKLVFECPTFDFALTSRFLLLKTASLAKKYGEVALEERCMDFLSDQDLSPQELTEGYMKLSDVLGENRMEIYRYVKDNPTDYSRYSDEEWDLFYDRSEVYYDLLRSEGKIFNSLLGKIKEINTPMLLLTSDFDAATCEKHIETFVSDAKKGQIYHFKECGHTPHYEKADEFARIVQSFVGGKELVFS